MRNDIKQLLAQKGYSPVFAAIEKSIRDLKQTRYERDEILETIYDIFGKNDQKIVDFIKQTI